MAKSKPMTQAEKAAKGREVQQKNKRRRQDEFLYVMERRLYNITEACRALGIGRRTYYDWMDEPEFKDRYTELMESRKDFVESALMRNIANGSSPDIKLFLTTQARDRGYVDMKQVDFNMSLIEKAERGELSADELKQMISEEQRKLSKAIEAGLIEFSPEEGDEDG